MCRTDGVPDEAKLALEQLLVLGESVELAVGQWEAVLSQSEAAPHMSAARAAAGSLTAALRQAVMAVREQPVGIAPSIAVIESHTRLSASE